MSGKSDPNRPVITTETALSIIEILKAKGEMSLAEIADELPHAKSTVHRHTETLVSTGFMIKNDSKYRLSLKFLEIGADTREDYPVFSASKSRVDELAVETGEKVWCVVEERGKSIHIYGHSGGNSIQSNVSIGNHTHLHQLAAGKAIMAHLPEQRIDDIVLRYGLPSATEHTITDRETLMEELAGIRERGVAFNQEESGYRLHAVGAPIRNEDDIAIGAISVSGPARRLTGEKFTSEIPELLLEATSDIEVDLLYS